MTNWTQQTEEAFKAWSEAQKKIMDNWAEAVKGLSGSQQAEMWQKTLAAWDDMMRKSMATQANLTQSWLNQFQGLEGMPAQAKDATQQFQEISRRWGSTQEQLWESWFKMLKGFDPSQFSAKWLEALQPPIQAWQQATKQVIDTQAEWLRTWMGTTERAAQERAAQE
jgi:hypothetical protein